MGNLLDYLAWRGDLSLDRVPFGPVDGLVLSVLSYVHFDGPAQGEKPKRKGRPPKSEKQAPGGGGAGKTAKTPRQGKAASQPAPAKEEAPPPPAPAPEEQTQPKDASRGEKEEIVYLDLDQLYPFQDHPFGVRDDNEMKAGA